jgi:hypothetical protein
MSEYAPDKWVIIKINSKNKYKVFASWYGGWAGSDSWRINSGISEITEDDNYYFFEGNTGSVYKCHKSGYGTTGYSQTVLDELINSQPEFSIEVMPEDTSFIGLV